MKKLKVLPAIDCVKGCSECCNVVPCTETEYQRIARFVAAHDVELRREDLRCPLLRVDGRCAVYELRPISCRVFGHVSWRPCPRGRNVDVDDRDIARMVRSIGLPTRILHELVGLSIGEVASALSASGASDSAVQALLTIQTRAKALETRKS